MALFYRRKFSTPESFHLFMEGLRALQAYDEEAGSEETPAKAVLEERLKAAEKFFRDGVALYPKDLLPRYYSGIVATMRAQQAHALYFEKLLNPSPAEKSATENSSNLGADPLNSSSQLKFETLKELPVDVDALLWVAAQEFSDTARRAGRGDLRSYALYNAAQALARRDNFSSDGKSEGESRLQDNWKLAQDILETINPDPMNKLGDHSQYWLILKFLFRRPIDWVLSKIVHFREQLEGTTGLAASIASAVAETEALKLQIELAYLFIDLRKNERWLNLYKMPKTAALEIDVPVSSSPLERTLGLLSRIKRANIPTMARTDLIADYWNKWAFVAWEHALNDELECGEWLKLVALYLSFIDRPTWTPWQMNKVRLLLAKALTHPNASEYQEEAQKMLTRILGSSEEITIRRIRRPARRLHRKKARSNS